MVAHRNLRWLITAAKRGVVSSHEDNTFNGEQDSWLFYAVWSLSKYYLECLGMDEWMNSPYTLLWNLYVQLMRFQCTKVFNCNTKYDYNELENEISLQVYVFTIDSLECVMF